MRDQDSLLGLVNRAGPGDTILVEQLYENTYLGRGSSNIAADPNPRLLAYIAARAPWGHGARAARRLLRQPGPQQPAQQPAHGGVPRRRSPRPKGSTCRRGGATRPARASTTRWCWRRSAARAGPIVGSLNGGEVSAKLNREMALLVGSDEVYAYLAEVFWYDWGVTP